MVGHHPSKFGGHRHCDSGNNNTHANMGILPQMRDVTSRTIYARLLPLLLFSLKHMSSHVLTKRTLN